MLYKDYKSKFEKSDFFKPMEGENRVRFVTEGAEFSDVYEDKKTHEKTYSRKFLAYIIDRADGKIKTYKFGPQVMGGLAALANSSEYGFDFVPPYDVIIVKTGEKLETEYTVQASRKDTELTEEEKTKILSLTPIDVLAKKWNKEPSETIFVDDEVHDEPILEE